MWRVCAVYRTDAVDALRSFIAYFTASFRCAYVYMYDVRGTYDDAANTIHK